MGKHEPTKMLMMIDYVREMTSKRSCKYGEYGSFEPLLFSCGFVFFSDLY